MRTIVINTGTELLLGDVLNTHLAFIARAILPFDLRVDRQITVPDGPAIRAALSDAFPDAELVFVTGGLGPTTDDITREITAELLGLKLQYDESVMAGITARAAGRGFRLTDRVPRQAQIPEGARVLPNEHGTAPGLYLAADSASKRPHLFLLPGPPRELQPMFKNWVLPILRKIIPGQAATERKTYRIAGLGESLVEEAIGSRLANLDLELGYCARPGEIDLRIIGQSSVLAEADSIIREAVGSSIFSDDGSSLEEMVVKRLAERKQTLAIAESCTGGYVAHRITNVPGASAVFLAGFVVYANEAKSGMLRVDSNLILQHGAVSEPVARAMADGARQNTGATFALATTGIAGPGGGTAEKPVGTVFVGLATAGGTTQARKFYFPDDRQTFKELTAQVALDMLRRCLI